MRLRYWFLLILFFTIGMSLILLGMYLQATYRFEHLAHYEGISARERAYEEHVVFGGQLSIFGALIVVFLFAIILVYFLIWRRY